MCERERVGERVCERERGRERVCVYQGKRGISFKKNRAHFCACVCLCVNTYICTCAHVPLNAYTQDRSMCEYKREGGGGVLQLREFMQTLTYLCVCVCPWICTYIHADVYP